MKALQIGCRNNRRVASILSRRAQSEIEPVAEDCFHDPMLSRASQSAARAEIDLPWRRQVQVDCGKDLLRLPLAEEPEIQPDSKNDNAILRRAGAIYRIRP
jgi:hypothetical protein